MTCNREACHHWRIINTCKNIYLYKIRRPLKNLEKLWPILICTSNPLCTRWSFDVEQLLHSQRVGLFVTHHGNIVETVEVGQSLLYKKKRNWILLGKGFPWMMQHLIEVLLHYFLTTVYFSHFQLRWWGVHLNNLVLDYTTTAPLS